MVSILKKAVALKYINNLPAPFILAKGKGELAEKIQKAAENNGISIVKDNNLAETLIEIDVGALIPEELYEIIANILIFVLDLRKEYAEN